MSDRILWTRRRLLETGTIAAGSVVLRTVLWPSSAEAATRPSGYLLLCYFNGGWDQLLALDPRDTTLPRFQQQSAYAPDGTGIYPAYDLVTDGVTKELLAANPTGVQRPQLTVSSPLTFGPAIPAALFAHAQDLCVVRGVNMGTLTHEVGRRYFLTGKFPRGLSASGSALPTAVAAQAGDVARLPNLSVGVETYNETFPAFASGLAVQGAGDVTSILSPAGAALSPGTDQALRAFEAQELSCGGHAASGTELATLFRASREKARELVVSGASSHFAFTLDPAQQSREIADLFATFGIVTPDDLASAKGQAALAAQALCRGISQAVSIQLAIGIDDHGDGWTRTHAPNLRAGFTALANLITYLKAAPDPLGGSIWERTTLLVFSEFSRTPLVNPRNGRDHHLASSCLLAGPGIKGNVVLGATSDAAMVARLVDLSTGLPDDSGVALRPADLHATVLQSMGLSYAHLANQTPQLLQAALR
ncbi:MAG: DUF1501 domain-containing protein [Myxococcales bacterium]